MSVTNKKISRGTIIVIAVALVAAVVVGLLTFRFSRDFFATTSLINIANTLPLAPDGSAAVQPTLRPGETATLLVPPSSVGTAPDEPPPAWDGTSRVTILVMGLDYRDWLQGTDVPRTDTMILFSIDPLTMQAGMLSIPRDMWVNIPGFGYSRINGAYRAGEMYKLPGGGPGLAMKTVEQFIGVPVDYYALIDFNSFVRFIDALGGLDMKIRTPLKIDPIGPGNTRTLEPGTQTLDGQAVLAYARNRYTKDGDFDRSVRQQEVVMALRNQIVNLNQLPDLVQKSPMLYQQISSGLRTNLTLDQVIRLSWLASKIDVKNIKKGVFDPHKDVQYYTVQTSDGPADVLVPNPDQIRLVRDSVFVTGAAYGPVAAGGDSTELMKAEQAKVIFRNATGKPELGTQAGDLMRSLGVQITGEEAAAANGQTTIVDHTGKPYTIKLLMEKLNLPNARITSKFDPASPVDIELNLGTDYTGQ